jgi:A/G-specific adenine glycosylase
MSRKRAAPESDPSLSDVIDKKSILYQWASHDDASYHDFLPKEAAEIREALLSWYRANRRKLPWRGDPPPYDGSTAGVNSNKTKKQKSNKANKQSGDEALPVSVSAYGVWVSEIMLQQTRVEAVIPYYRKCK